MGGQLYLVVIFLFRERKVGPSQTSRLLVDENDWDICRPCNEDNKVTTTRPEHTLRLSKLLNCLSRILISLVLHAVLQGKGLISIRPLIYPTIKVVERLELINELSAECSPGKIIILSVTSECL